MGSITTELCTISRRNFEGRTSSTDVSAASWVNRQCDACLLARWASRNDCGGQLARQRAPHSAESALNACQLLSTEIPSLAAMLADPTHTGRACCEVLRPNTGRGNRGPGEGEGSGGRRGGRGGKHRESRGREQGRAGGREHRERAEGGSRGKEQGPGAGGEPRGGRGGRGPGDGAGGGSEEGAGGGGRGRESGEPGGRAGAQGPGAPGGSRRGREPREGAGGCRGAGEGSRWREPGVRRRALEEGAGQSESKRDHHSTRVDGS